MKFFVLILFTILLLVAPIFVFADCSKAGTTVIFINGIWEDEASARSDKNLLQNKFLTYSNLDNVTFISGYNASHAGGAADIINSIMEAYGNNGVDYDLTNILLKAHTDLATQKILLVGHSQGTFYTNAAYDYLTGHGVDANSIAVYNVATPADKVEGGGKYLTSSTDEVISTIVATLAQKAYANKPLPANIDIKIPKDMPQSVSEDGHSFNAVYLGLAPDRIIGDMDTEINNLKSGDSNKTECFAEPKTDVVYNIKDGVYKTIDEAITYFGETPTSPFKTPEQMLSFASGAWQGIYGFGKSIFNGIGNVFASIGSNVFLTSSLTGSLTQEPAIYTPIEPISVQNEPQLSADTGLADYNGTGGPEINPSTEEGAQDLLDDIQEKLDIIRQQILLLLQKQNPSLISKPDDKINEKQDKQDDQNDQNQEDNQDDNQNDNTGSTSSGGDSPTFGIVAYTISNLTISPDGDGVDDTTSIDLEFSEQVKTDVNIFDSNGEKVRDLYSSSSVKNPEVKIWDGKDNSEKVVPNGVYTISVAISDSAGNSLTDTSKTITVDAIFQVQPETTPKILINEVQIEGADVRQDFIELYNPSNTDDVYLKGYRLVKRAQTSTTDTTIKSWADDFISKIPPNSYYLWVSSTDEDYPALISADVWTKQNISSNNGIGIRYGAENTGQLIDAVGWGTFSNTLFKGNSYPQNPEANHSIQRRWDLSTNKPQDTNNNSIDFMIFNQPTPKADSPRYYLFDNSMVASDLTLKKSQSPYLFKGNIHILSGVTLTIEPGVVIKFYDTASGMTVDGTIKAVGTDADKIIFTSFLDDEYGGDANADGNSSSPAAGDWQTINFTGNSLDSEFQYVLVRYGGIGLKQWGSAVIVNQSSFSLKNSVFENNLNRGLCLINSKATIDSNQFLNQEKADMWSDFIPSAVYVVGGSGQITNNYFKDNATGISLNDWSDSLGNTSGAEMAVQNNNFEDEAHSVILNTFDGPSFSGNKIVGDPDTLGTFNAILVHAGTHKDVTLKPDLPYLFDNIYTVYEGSTLTLEPGVIVEFRDNWAAMEIHGTLKAIGTSDNPIIFRHYYYDRDWSGPGKWLGLYFAKSSKDSDLENIDISFAGSLSLSDKKSYGAAIRVDQSSISLKNSKVWSNSNCGIFLENSGSVIDGVQFFNHKETGAAAVAIQGGSPEIKNSNFQTQSYGIYKSNWINPDTAEVVPPTPNLHDLDPADPEKNLFTDSIVADIYTAP